MTNVADMTDVEKITVLDYGSQYNRLVTRRIRDPGVFSELLSYRTIAEEVKVTSPKGTVLSGGPNSICDENALGIDPEIFNLGVPVLGICYGIQLIMCKLGSSVGPVRNREYGKVLLGVIGGQAILFRETPKQQTVWTSHGGLVTKVPRGFGTARTSKDCLIASIQDTTRNLYGIQFHAKVRHSEYGTELLHHFAFDVCHCEGSWTMDNFTNMQVEKIREQVGDERALLGLSGGIDSSVVGVFLQKTIDD